MFKFYTLKSFRSAKHLGFLGVIVSLSVFFSAFSVFSIISLSNELGKAITLDTKEELGGDVTIKTLPDNLEETENLVKQLKKDKKVNDYSITINSDTNQIQAKDSEIIFVNLTGLVSSNYPILNTYKLSSGKSFDEVLKAPDSVVISKDMQKKLGKNIGDTVTIFGWDPIYNKTFKVADVITESKTREGNLFFVSKESYEEYRPIDALKISLIGNTNEITKELENYEIDYSTVEKEKDENQTISKTFSMFFRGMSILGLFIGSLGIVSSMSVLISRRRNEIAILKTIGYKKSNIVIMFLFELLGISLLGSIAGIALGYLFFSFLISILNSVINGAVLQNEFNLNAFVIAFFASTISTIIFTSYTIISNLELKPADLLRDDINSVRIKRLSIQKILLLVLIALSFTGLSALIVGDLLVGAAIVGGSLICIILASLIFRIVIWLFLRLPFPKRNIFSLSWINLKGSYKKTILGIIAIFVGIVCIGFIFAIFKTSNEELDSRLGNIEAEHNIVVYEDGGKIQENKKIEDILNSGNDVKDFTIRYRGMLESSALKQKDLPLLVEGVNPDKIGRDVRLTSVTRFSNGVLLNQIYETTNPIGSNLEINGEILQVEGYYARDIDSIDLISMDPSIIVSEKTFLDIFSENYQKAYLVTVSYDHVTTLANSLKQVNGTLVFDIVSIDRQIQNNIVTLVWVVVSIASLSLLAGAILVINTTNLEVVNRRRSFGILKAIGFKNSQVRTLFLAEFGFLIVIAAMLAFAVDFASVKIINKIEPWGKDENFEIIFDVFGTLAVIVGTVVLILGLIYLSSRKYLKVRPVELLRSE
jgi:putative ABC transport system permease protein